MPLQGAETLLCGSPRVSLRLPWAMCSIGLSARACQIRNLNDIIYALMPQKKLTYEQAMQRLETIVQGFEQNTLELDQLTAQLAEAQQLIKMCNDKLQQVETDVKQILNNEQE